MCNEVGLFHLPYNTTDTLRAQHAAPPTPHTLTHKGLCTQTYSDILMKVMHAHKPVIIYKGTLHFLNTHNFLNYPTFSVLSILYIAMVLKATQCNFDHDTLLRKTKLND